MPDISGSTFVIETRRRGTSASLATASVTNPAIGTSAATELVLSGPNSAQGSGSVPDLGQVDAATSAGVIQTSIIDEISYDVPDHSFTHKPLTLHGSAYEAPRRDLTHDHIPVRPLLKEFATIQSRRSGCMSSITPMVFASGSAVPPAFDMDFTLTQAPATRAAIQLKPFASQTLSGTLEFKFNENDSHPEMPAEIIVPVSVPSATYAPQDLAKLIHNQLFEAGIGMARAYTGGAIMVETQAIGIGGTIRVTTPDSPLESTLFGDKTFSRGWPNAGRLSPGRWRLPGFRSASDSLSDAPFWTFTDGLPPTTTGTPPVCAAQHSVVTFAAGSGDSMESVATRLNEALGRAALGTATKRIGFAAVGDDGRLYIEGLDSRFDLITSVEVKEDDCELDVTPFPPTAPAPRVGGTPERQTEPAAGLRRTHEIRTMRLIYDRNGQGVEEQFNDFQWLRVPAHPETGARYPFPHLVAGRYRAVAQVDAAKSGEYSEETNMLVVVGELTTPVILQARFWMEMDHSVEFGTLIGPDGKILLNLELGMRGDN